MVPRSIRQQLNRLNQRERWLQFVWMAARWLPVLALALVGACLLDWLIDLRRDTPFALRVALLLGQLLLWSVALTVLGPVLTRRLSDTQLALWVEDKIPRLGHRLISAVQLNQPDAATRGMSPAMIAAVTRQAEEEAATMDFARLADARRLAWSVGLLTPCLLGVVLVMVLFPSTVQALLARVFLVNRDIPRSVSVESLTPQLVAPAGEDVVLRFRVRGPALNEDLKGEVRVDPDDRPSERYELVYESSSGAEEATFVVRVPASTVDFACQAWLKDGRTRQPTRVHFEPRPVVQKQEAWIQLPEYVTFRPASEPLEEPQKGGDIVYRLAGSKARIAIEVQKPIVAASVEILGPPHPFTATGITSDARSEMVRRSVALTVQAEDTKAEGVLPLAPAVRPEFLALLGWCPAATAPQGVPWASLLLSSQIHLLPPESGYRIVVRDRHGFENLDRPRRGIRTAPVDPPEVAFKLESQWEQGDTGSPEDLEVEGIPILLGGRVRIEYLCSAPYGLSHAQLRFRVIKQDAGKEEDPALVGEAEFLPLPLGPTLDLLRTGPPKANDKALREFHTWPWNDPQRLSGTNGSGRYDFNSTGIPDGKGGYLELKVGDRIQYYVEVFGRADPKGQPGRSMIREKAIVAENDLLAWLRKKDDPQQRIRQIEEKQRGRNSPTPAGSDRPPRTTPGGSGTPLRPEPSALNLPMGRSWQLLGPLPDRDNKGHARKYPPEEDPTDLGKEFDGVKGKIGWQPYHSPTDQIDLKKFFNHGDAGVAYAVCWVNCGKRSAILATGSDDGIKVWLDRKLVLDKAVTRDALPGEDKTPVDLEDAWQEVLVKVDNRFDTWSFFLELQDPKTGKPLEFVNVRITPPGYDEKRFIRDWQILGPFASADNAGHKKLYPPELEPRVNLTKEYEGRKVTIRWQTHRGAKDKIDLLKLFQMSSEDAAGVAYAVCWVRCPRRTKIQLATGSDDGIKVWINRRLVVDKEVEREAEPGSDKTLLELASGWNELLVKVDNKFGRWAFCMEMYEPASGRPLDGLEFQLTPP